MEENKCRIFILSQWMNIGGIESSLLGLLKEFDYSKVDIDLCLQHHCGEWFNEIPREVNLLPFDRKIARINIGLKTALDNHDYVAWLFIQLQRYLSGIYYRVFKHCKVDEIGFEQIGWLLKRWMLPRSIGAGKYDLCLIFGAAPGFARLVDARKRVAWIHTDWATYKPVAWLTRLQFAGLDFVVNVSEEAKVNFDKIARLPLPIKSIVIENVLSPKWISKRADQSHVDECEGIKILSVGRVTAPKNYFRALEAAQILKKHAVTFKWLVVGDGESFDSLKKAVDNSGLGDSFLLVGKKTNPYPYYKWCDLLVCTSDWEGKSVAVREAQMFAKPVVVTRFPTATSQVTDGVDGLLVDRTPEAVADGVERLLYDAGMRDRLARNCGKRDYANLGEISKILALYKDGGTK